MSYTCAIFNQDCFLFHIWSIIIDMLFCSMYSVIEILFCSPGINMIFWITDIDTNSIDMIFLRIYHFLIYWRKFWYCFCCLIVMHQYVEVIEMIWTSTILAMWKMILWGIGFYYDGLSFWYFINVWYYTKLHFSILPRDTISTHDVWL